MEDRGRGRGEAASGGGGRTGYTLDKLLDFFTPVNADLLLFQIKDNHDPLP